jgi:hypothetical protein
LCDHLDLEESDGFTEEDAEDNNSAAEDIEDLLGDFITSFVTKPDLERGFQWSGKTQSHVHLENVNHSVRRRLAGTLLSIERSRVGLGGLLDNDYVHENVLDRVNGLGQKADRLCSECEAAKRGTADLTLRTERLQHSVTVLHNWIDWLRLPTIPGSDGRARPAVPLISQSAAAEAAGGKGERSTSSSWGANGAALGRLAATLREKARKEAEAADRAMQELLQGAIAFHALSSACLCLLACLHTVLCVHRSLASSCCILDHSHGGMSRPGEGRSHAIRMNAPSARLLYISPPIVPRCMPYVTNKLGVTCIECAKHRWSWQPCPRKLWRLSLFVLSSSRQLPFHLWYAMAQFATE